MFFVFAIVMGILLGYFLTVPALAVLSVVFAVMYVVLWYRSYRHNACSAFYRNGLEVHKENVITISISIGSILAAMWVTAFLVQQQLIHGVIIR